MTDNNKIVNESERLQLQKMIAANNAEDNTELIRKSKHSGKIQEQVQLLLQLKRKYPRLQKTNPEQFDKICVSKCGFLFQQYTDIFNKVKKDEIDLTILSQFLSVLKQIEDGKLGQHEASVQVGRILKKLYIDSALRRQTNSTTNIPNQKERRKRTWSKIFHGTNSKKPYKKHNNHINTPYKSPYHINHHII